MDVMQIFVPITTKKIVKPRLEAYIPVVSGLKNPKIEQKINKEIQNLMEQMIKDQGYYENPETQITGQYEIKTNEREVLSLALINYAYSGGAHGLTLVKSLTFDVNTGKVYKLNDLFKPNSSYVKKISDLVARQIKERNIPLLDGFNGIKPDQDFYIADKSLVVYFQLYEIAAYVFGILYFPISLYEILDIINDNDILGRLLY